MMENDITWNCHNTHNLQLHKDNNYNDINLKVPPRAKKIATVEQL